MYSFTGGSDGAYPVGGLLQAADGQLYGTAPEGGIGNNGVVFKIGVPVEYREAVSSVSHIRRTFSKL